MVKTLIKKLNDWLDKFYADHNDGTRHAWEPDGPAFIHTCRVCGEVDFGPPRID